jgi:hypothetical protein
MAEYFLRNPALNLTGAMREQVVRFGGTYECEHSVFWTPNPRVLILPAGYDPLWFSDIHQVLGLQPPPVVSPARRAGLLVQDLLHDGAGQAALREQLTGHRVVRMINTGPTPDLYRLVAMLRGWGLTVELDGVTEEHYWTSLYLDSKVSVLDLARQMPEIRVASGLLVSSWEELRGAVDVLLARHGRVIARSLHGVAGDGSAVTTADPARLARFFETIERDSFFGFPLIVQEFIEHAPDVGCPAVDILVDEDGVQDVVLCSLTVVGGHHFRSVNVGPGALPEVWAKRVTQVAYDLGTAARDLGYRGWMCADCVAGADDQLYVTEINARRSGSQHAGSLLRLWGAERELTISAHFMVPVPAGASYADQVRPVFQPLWESGVRAYPTTVRGMAWPDPIMAVIAAAPTALEAEQIVAGIADAVSPARASGSTTEPALAISK